MLVEGSWFLGVQWVSFQGLSAFSSEPAEDFDHSLSLSNLLHSVSLKKSRMEKFLCFQAIE